MSNAQVIKCKCGEIFAACVEPECYMNADWQREMRKCVKKGCTVEIMPCGDAKMSKCKCKELAKELAESNTNQTKLEI